MKAKTVCLLMAIFLVVCTANAQGTLVDDYFISTALGEERLVQVYLPEGYNDPGNTDHYPMVMFLHGDTAIPSWYTGVIALQLDSLISNELINPMIVAFPDGSTEIFSWLSFNGGSWYTNSELYGDFEDFIVQDVITHVDANYRTLATFNWRCIMGHSMGGFGSMKLAVTHPSLFKGVAAHAGLLDYGKWEETQVPLILAENGDPPYDWSPYVLSSTLITFLTFHEAGAFSPNSYNPPYRVDFPLDEYGALIDTVFDRWLEHNPAELVQGLQPGELEIYFDCGTADPYLLHVWNESFADTLDALGLDYTFLSHSGGHTVPERYPISFMWLDSVMHHGWQDFTVNLTYNSGSPVPAGGGYINFDVFLQNNETSTINFDLWIEIPPQVTPPSVPNRNLTFPDGFSITRPDMDWPIPASWPAGNYDMVWNIGVLSSLTVWATDSFPFEKSADDDGGGYALWEVEGDPLDQLFKDTEFGGGSTPALPGEFALYGAYPNPFNPTSTIRFDLPEATRVNLMVYDVSGRLVAEVVDGWRDAGYHEVTFDGMGLASGMYFYRIEAGEFNAVRKMILIK